MISGGSRRSGHVAPEYPHHQILPCGKSVAQRGHHRHPLPAAVLVDPRYRLIPVVKTQRNPSVRIYNLQTSRSYIQTGGRTRKQDRLIGLRQQIVNRGNRQQRRRPRRASVDDRHRRRRRRSRIISGDGRAAVPYRNRHLQIPPRGNPGAQPGHHPHHLPAPVLPQAGHLLPAVVETQRNRGVRIYNNQTSRGHLQTGGRTRKQDGLVPLRQQIVNRSNRQQRRPPRRLPASDGHRRRRRSRIISDDGRAAVPYRNRHLQIRRRRNPGAQPGHYPHHLPAPVLFDARHRLIAVVETQRNRGVRVLDRQTRRLHIQKRRRANGRTRKQDGLVPLRQRIINRGKRQYILRRCLSDRLPVVDDHAHGGGRNRIISSFRGRTGRHRNHHRRLRRHRPGRGGHHPHRLPSPVLG